MADSADYDYLRNEVARRLADRLLDIHRKFPVAVDLGAGSGHLRKFLGDRGGIEELIQLEMSGGWWGARSRSRTLVLGLV